MNEANHVADLAVLARVSDDGASGLPEKAGGLRIAVHALIKDTSYDAIR